MIIGEMIDMMMTDVMIIIGIIIVEIIDQEMIEDHTRVNDIMMIDEEIMTDMIIVDTTMIEGIIIIDPKDLDRSNIKVETILTHKMLNKQRMRKEKLVDQRCRIAICVRGMATMPINVHLKTKEKHRQ
mgnify:CR=1 FL=1